MGSKLILAFSVYMDKKEYDEIFSKVPRLCVDLLIVSESGFLVGKRTHEPFANQYAFPGGRLKFGETVKVAAKRIALEELDSRISFLTPAKGYIEFTQEISICNKHSISIPVLCAILDTRFPTLKGNHFSELTYHTLVDKSLIVKPMLQYIKQHYPLLY